MADITQADFRKLLTQAFEAARSSGKTDWREMTTAVLKNRILQATERTFDESDYEASSFLELVARYPDLVRVDPQAVPTKLHWLPASDQAGERPESLSARRIREDLWRAVLDYSSGREYEWDPATGQARPVVSAERSLRLPSISKPELQELRRKFASENPAMDPVEQSRIHEWAESGLGIRLPQRLQGEWNATLKREVVNRLSEWFSQTTFRQPDLMGSSPQRAEAKDLRAFVQECVSMMSQAELRSLQLPAHVMMRVSRRGQ